MDSGFQWSMGLKTAAWKCALQLGILLSAVIELTHPRGSMASTTFEVAAASWTPFGP
jgi:hypothetical protein